MRLLALGLLAGTWLLQQQADLPGATWLAAMACAGLLLVVVVVVAVAVAEKSAPAGRRAVRGMRLLALLAGAALLGAGWAGLRAQWRLADVLPAAMEGRDTVVTGVVAGLPQAMERGVRFEFRVESAGGGDGGDGVVDATVPSRLWLAWYRSERDDAAPDSSLGLGGLGMAPAAVPPLPVRAGERWRFTVRLRRPHGNLNPHGFDYEAWLLERGLRATGYVRPRAEAAPERLAGFAGWGSAVDAAREALRDRYRLALGEAPYAGILTALAIGDQQAIDADLWRLFARTGITHLMSISGLHVTMLAALAWMAAAWLWRRSARLPLYLPAQQAGALAGLLAALAYSLLAGFAVPAQRTLYMLAVAVGASLLRREFAATRVLAAALVVVVLADPWAVLAAGFWLSFGAVALLFLAARGGVAQGGREGITAGRAAGAVVGLAEGLRDWLRAQWAITLGLLPALLALFQQFSLVSPLANALAIPVVSFVVTPLALAGAVPGLAWLLAPAHAVTEALMAAMAWLGAQPWAVWQQAAPPAWAVALALAGAFWLLLPRGVPSRWVGVLCFLPLLTLEPPRPAPGAARVAVLDVGQGLAVHVQTAAHDLLFDAGPAYSAEANSGTRVIVPYLRAAGVRRLDAMVVSHRDKDHEGGAEAVLAALPVAALVTSLPFDHPLSAAPVPHRPCVDGERWEWDGVRFAMLHPPAGYAARRSNEVSCVLRVEAAGRAVLLTSDIEAEQESALAGRHAGALRADAVLVPHHGSRSSSTPGFIAAVGAAEAIIPVGYRSRFGHPRPEVVARWEAAGARLHRTDLDGAVTVDLDTAGLRVSHERVSRMRYWHGR